MTLVSQPSTISSSDLEWKLKYNWLEILKEAELVGLDTETNTLNLFDPTRRVNGFSLAIRRKGQIFSDYFPVAHKRGANLPESIWRPILELAITKWIVCHNVNFDRKSVAILTGIRPPKFFDTTRLSHLHDENYKNKRSLENMSLKYCGNKGKVKSIIFEALLRAYGWDGISSGEIREYGEADAEAVLVLGEELMKRVEKTVPQYWNEIDLPNYNTLYDMKELGIGVNLEFCKEWELRGTERMAELREELGFDPASSNELKRVFYDELGLPIITAKRKKSDGSYAHTPTLDKGAMERYELILERTQNPMAQRILEFRGWQKAVSSYYRAYQEHVHVDGRIRPDYAMHGTVTGRYSCSQPNLQQIPKETNKPWNGKVKQCFQPALGYELWEFDYSQLEFRMAAHFSREPKLLDVFNDYTRDIFNEMSADLGMPRQDCKTQTYSIQYGAGAQRIMDVFGCSREEAIKRIEDFYRNYPGLAEVSDHVKGIIEQHLKVKLWSGRYRHFQTSKDGYKAFNSFIQGGAADLVKHVMNRIRQELPEVRMLLQVHDSIVFELPVGRVEEYKAAISTIMENPFVEPWRVKFKVDAHKMWELAA